MIRIRKDICLILITFILLTAAEFTYAQKKMSTGISEKSNNSFIYRDKDSPGKSEAELHEIYRNSTKNYFKIDRSGMSLWNGKHWVPENFPLKIYIRESESDKYKSIYKEFIDYGFKVWQKADSRIKYSYVSSPEKADIVILFEENLMDKYDENFLGLTDYELGSDREIKLSTIEISLLKFDDDMLSEGEIKATILHEIGHALGLGHSNNSADLMYPYIDPESNTEMNYDELSRGDSEAIRSVIDLSFYLRYSLN